MNNAESSLKLLCLDVDGVLTDGRLLLDADGRETKQFHIHDGLGIRLWQRTGRQVAIITGRSSQALTARCHELGISLLLDGQSDKLPAFERVLALVGCTAAQTVMIGDDLPDLPLIQAAGIGIAVSNAVAEVKLAASVVTTRAGGEGAVREAIETLLKAAGEWDELVESYSVNLVKDPTS